MDSHQFDRFGNAQKTLLFLIFQAEDGIRDQPRSRGLGDVYKRQQFNCYHGTCVECADVPQAGYRVVRTL